MRLYHLLQTFFPAKKPASFSLMAIENFEEVMHSFIRQKLFGKQTINKSTSSEVLGKLENHIMWNISLIYKINFDARSNVLYIYYYLQN